jgi:hypothetical protein
MKVLNSGTANYSIQFIPRVYSLDNTVLELTNIATKVVTTVSHTIAGDDGILSLQFTATFIEGERYKLNLYTSTDTLYMCQILITNQDTQEYNVSKNFIQYE